MTKVTNFSRFRRAVDAWVGEDTVRQVWSELEAGSMDADRSNVIETDSGLFSLILKNGQVYATKVVLHISDLSLSHLKSEPSAYAEYLIGNYDAPPILEKAHRYHFLSCSVVEGMLRSGRKYRLKQSRGIDGKFHYNFMSGNKIDIARQDQKLYPCMLCLRKFLHTRWVRRRRETFLPNDFFSKAFPSDWLEDCGYSQDFRPNVYSEDFKKISARVRELRNYTCEWCGLCLNAKEDRKFLHCHHRDGDKSNNSIKNLSALCIKCHSEQPSHNMSGLPEYREFMKKFGSHFE